MLIYYDPCATTCRPLMLFAHDHHALEIEWIKIELFAGEHQSASFTAINPNQAVPVLVDGTFRLVEGAAILRYLADLVGSPTYPTDLKDRARVNAALDWLNTGFYRDFGYNLVYPQVLPAYRRENPVAQAELLAWGQRRSDKWLRIMNNEMLSGRRYLVGDELTIADYLGIAYVTLGEWAGIDLRPHQNVLDWIGRMKARPGWDEINTAFDAVRDDMNASLRAGA